MTQANDLSAEVLAKSSKGVGIARISDIYFPPDRMRQDSDRVRNYIENELVPSFVENGCIQPPVLHLFDKPTEIDGQTYLYQLIAGGCRSQAFRSLGCDSIPFNTRESLRPDQLQQLEIEENFTRLDMTWQEYCMGIASTHRTKTLMAQAKGEKWTQKMTGKLVGGFSHAHVGDCLKIDEALRAGDKEVWAASGITAATQVLLSRKQDALLADLAKSAGALPTAVKKSPGVGPVRESSGFDLNTLISDATTQSENVTVSETKLVESYEVDLSQVLFNTDNRDFFAQCEPESFDLIYTDIPYGIDMDNLDFSQADLDRVVEEHDVDENVSQMLPFLQNAYRVLKDKTYLLFWYDIKHHEKLVAWGQEVGFTVQPYPIIWNKLHPCRNRSAGTWWTKSIEYCMVMRKGTATLRSPQLKCVIDADGSAERKMQRNPFVKPFELSQKLLEPVIIPGMRVLDPYAGEGSLVRAVLNLGCQVVAVEKSEKHFPGLTEHVKEVYRSLTRGKVNFA
jgi:DNA modification methylase